MHRGVWIEHGEIPPRCSFPVSRHRSPALHAGRQDSGTAGGGGRGGLDWTSTPALSGGRGWSTPPSSQPAEPPSPGTESGGLGASSAERAAGNHQFHSTALASTTHSAAHGCECRGLSCNAVPQTPSAEAARVSQPAV